MADSYRFWLLQFLSHDMRGEVLNVGLLFERDGTFEVRTGRKLDKLKAISAAIDASDVEAEIAELPDLLNGCSADDVISCLQSVSFLAPTFKGEVASLSPDLNDYYFADLMARYVDPEPAPPKPVKKRPTRLRQEIRSALLSENILARPSEGLESHRVLYKHKLSEGVEADFVLKNGSLHVVESVDASSDKSTLQRSLYEIAMSALTFEHARINFGNNSVKPRLVYNASPQLETALEPSLYAARHQGAELVNWANGEAREAFLATLATLAESRDENKRTPDLFHASSLPRRQIN